MSTLKVNLLEDTNGNPLSLVKQVVNFETSNLIAGTSAMPFDDTIPQNTEGTEFLQASITPKKSTNKLLIHVNAFLNTGNANHIEGALFQDSTAAAIAATSLFQDTANGSVIFVLDHFMTAGTTSTTAFKFRAGRAQSGNLYLNGQQNNRKLGGVAASSITITEFEA